MHDNQIGRPMQTDTPRTTAYLYIPVSIDAIVDTNMEGTAPYHLPRLESKYMF
jgi:hypothetical protein